MKTCTGCAVEQSDDEFYRKRKTATTTVARCKGCLKAKEKAAYRQNPKPARARAKRYWTKEGLRGRDLRKHYNMTQADFDAMLTAQGGRCANCKTDKPGGHGRFSVDHDHVTGKVRGLLCFHCNTGIGKLGDSIEGLERALAYLRSHA